MIKWSSGQKQKYVPTQIPFYAWERLLKAKIIQIWEGQVEEYRMSPSYKELLGIDGEATEFEWNISQDLRHCRSFKRFRIICNS